MKDRADARWLPSRFRFAMFRLFAWLRLRRSRPEVESGLVLAVDRDQTAAESYIVGMWVVSMTGLFIAAVLERTIASWAAVPLGILGAILLLQALVALSAVSSRRWRQENHIAFHSRVQMFIVGAAAVYFVNADRWIRHVARFVIVIIAVNALAALVLRVMQRHVEAAEREIISP